MKKGISILLVVILCMGLSGCVEKGTEQAYTEYIMGQANSEVGMPNITEFYEKKLAKEIFEKRDDSELVCYAYTYTIDGKYVYLGRCMGYGLPFSTQYTAPTIDGRLPNGTGEYGTIQQADPNGLYTADGLAATWLLMIDEETGETYIMYSEPELVVTEHKMPKRLVDKDSLEGVEY